MSRVQKGNQKFKPVAVARGRSEGTPIPKKPAYNGKEGRGQAAPPDAEPTSTLQLPETEALHVSQQRIPSLPSNALTRAPTPSSAANIESTHLPSVTVQRGVGTEGAQGDFSGTIGASVSPEVRSTDVDSFPNLSTTSVPKKNVSNYMAEPAPSSSDPRIPSPLVHALDIMRPEPGPSTVVPGPNNTEEIVESSIPGPENTPQECFPLQRDRADEDVDSRMGRARRSSRLRTASARTISDTENNEPAISERPPRNSNPRARAGDVQGDAAFISEESDGGAKSPGQKRKRKRSTTGASGRRRRRTTAEIEVFDEGVDPGEELDPTVVTMATICEDTGQGRVSSKAAIIQRNHIAWKAANRAKRERMRAAMEAKKYGRKDDDEAPQQPVEKNQESDTEENGSQGGTSTPAAADPSGNDFDYKQSLAANQFNAQIRIGPNGETIIDEESLFVERVVEDDSTSHYQHVEESDQTKFTNSATYGKKPGRSSRWSVEETELFFDALSQFGENYELISLILPGRDRKACKSKFKTEDKRNPNRVTYCLTHLRPYDMETLSRLTGKDFSGPTPQISAPPPPDIGNDHQTLEEAPEAPEKESKKPRKKSKTPGPAEDVEVVGDIDNFDPGFVEE